MTKRKEAAEERQLILGADRALLIEGIKHLYNCREAKIDRYGDVLIYDPHPRHWLDADGLRRIARAIRSGDI